MICGSYRRELDSIGDLDILVEADVERWKAFVGIISVELEASVLSAGQEKVSIVVEIDDCEFTN